MTPESLTEKFALIHEHWRPKVVAKLNGQEVKLMKSVYSHENPFQSNLYA
jgi:hypothetical protein